MAKKTQAVMVTTEFRGVFFGYLESIDGGTAVLTKARNCIYWSADVKGFMGLATTGPTKSCKIGPAVPRITLLNVTSVVECEEAAIKAWEASPWSM